MPCLSLSCTLIIVNGRPTKSKVVWCNLVDKNRVKAATQRLKESNWLHNDVSDESLDEAAKRVIDVTNNATTDFSSLGIERIWQTARRRIIELLMYTLNELTTAARVRAVAQC